MKRFPLTVSLLFFVLQISFAQTIPPQPRLVVGIVVDQMRYDFLYRYQSKYVAGGFRRLLGEGFSCENTHYNYAPTYTAPGHAAIYTGATPSVSGIIANEWWDPEWREHRYVTTDKRYKTVGSPAVKVGQHSPAVLLSTTITDELRLSDNFKSKVVGVCLKDRASILPAGHIPNACYWFDDATGNWITSTYYPDSLGLPQWVQDFNARRLPDAYLSRPWATDSTLRYDESFAGWDRYDDGDYTSLFKGKKMPYDLPALKKTGGYGVLRFTPYGNSLTLDFAMETIGKMQLGADDAPDFLASVFPAPTTARTSSASTAKKWKIRICDSIAILPGFSIFWTKNWAKTTCWCSSPPTTAAAKHRSISKTCAFRRAFFRKANWKTRSRKRSLPLSARRAISFMKSVISRYGSTGTPPTTSIWTRTKWHRSSSII